MIRLDAAVVAEFLAALRRCAPVGEARPSAAVVRCRTTAAEAVLTGRAAGVVLRRHIAGPFTPAVVELTAAELAAAAGRAIEAVELRGTGSRSTAGLSLAEPGIWQPAGATFVGAMRDAARTASRAAHRSHEVHRVLLDVPAGKVAATDRMTLFVHGGFAWAAPRPVLLPAVGVWAAPFWRTAAEAEIAFAGDAVAVRAGPWSVSLPVDQSGRFPRYRELLNRLRIPAARIVLAEADATVWMAGLTAWRKGPSADEPVTVSFADPPTLSGGTGSACLTAAASCFAGRRTVRIASSAGCLARALTLGFRTLCAVGPGQPLVALDGPRRFVWAPLDEPSPTVTLPASARRFRRKTARHSS